MVITNQTSTQVLEKDAVLAALENSLAMIEFDPQGNVLWANENFASTIGYSVSELKNMHHRRFCSEEFTQSRAYEQFWNRLRSNHTFQEKVQRITKQQTVIWLEATYTPVLDEHGRVKAIIKVATDITARENGISTLTTELKTTAELLNERANQGVQRSNDVASAISEMVEQTAANIETLKTLTTQTESIRDMVRTIDAIATQTNLISLNAGIQAAHAGVHGRAFDVVAKEVRKLAKKSKDSTEVIHREAEEIIQQVQRISKGTTSSEKTINKGSEQIEQALHEFHGIGETAKTLDTQAETLVAELRI